MTLLTRIVNRRHAYKVARRNSLAIHAYVGANGGGKSAAMVADAIPDLEAGRPVLSTVRILDYTNPRECDDDWCASNPQVLGHYNMVPTEAGRAAEVRNAKALFFGGENAPQEPVERVSLGVHQAAHPLWIPWARWDQLLMFNFGRVLADEMTGIASSRESQTLPSEVLNHLQQLRRADIPFAYTCPDWARADKSLREPTQAVTVCRGYFPTEAPMHGDRKRVWRPRRMFKWRTYDARALDLLTEGKQADITPESVEWHWGPDSISFAAYDTFAPVLKVGTMTASGQCFRCGGRRRSVSCSCADHVHAPSHDDSERGAPPEVGPAPRRRALVPVADA